MAANLPVFNFTHHDSLAAFTISQQKYVANHPNSGFTHLATSSLVVDSSGSKPRILLLQRAAHDSSPNKWEPPGGACDDEDETILYGAARELWEEAGLKVSRYESVVGKPRFFSTRSGKQICRFAFAARVEGNGGQVKLDPNEHQNSVWATEDEVRAKKAGDIELEFTYDEVDTTVLLAFKTFDKN